MLGAYHALVEHAVAGAAVQQAVAHGGALRHGGSNQRLIQLQQLSRQLEAGRRLGAAGVLAEVDWVETGVFVSRLALGEADRQFLKAALAQAAQSRAAWRLFNEALPPGILGDSVRPLDVAP